MDRRSFIRSILAAGASCAILPSALTYARKWKPTKIIGTSYFYSFKPLENAGVWQFETATYHSVRGLGYALYHPEYLARF